MSAPRVSMHLVKEVLRLTAAGLSQRQIGRSLHLSHGVVGKYQAAAQRAGLSWLTVSAHCSSQPGFGKRLIAHHRTGLDGKHLGCFLNAQSAEEPQFDDLTLARVQLCQTLQRITSNLP